VIKKGGDFSPPLECPAHLLSDKHRSGHVRMDQTVIEIAARVAEGIAIILTRNEVWTLRSCCSVASDRMDCVAHIGPLYGRALFHGQILRRIRHVLNDD